MKSQIYSEEKAKLLFIISIPRSLSTIFMRTLMNFPESKAFGGQFSKLVIKNVLVEKVNQILKI